MTQAHSPNRGQDLAAGERAANPRTRDSGFVEVAVPLLRLVVDACRAADALLVQADGTDFAVLASARGGAPARLPDGAFPMGAGNAYAEYRPGAAGWAMDAALPGICPHLAFLAVAPVRFAVPAPAGLLCVLDTRPRKFPPALRARLTSGADMLAHLHACFLDLARLRHMAGALDRAVREIVIYDTATSSILYANDQLSQDTGYSVPELQSLRADAIARYPAPEELRARFAQLDAAGQSDLQIDATHLRRDGSAYPVSVQLYLSRQGGAEAVVALATDMTGAPRLEEMLKGDGDLYRSLFEHNPDPVYMLDRDGYFLTVNHAFERLTGYHAGELQRRRARELLLPEEVEQALAHFALAAQGKAQEYDVTLCARDGRHLRLDIANIPIIVGGRIIGVYGTARDVTALHAQTAKLTRLADNDPLTGLPNRRLFMDRLRHALARAGRHRHAVALMFLDLDRFKAINDTYGHDVGDLVLKETSRRLCGLLRREDTVARLAGDEFTIILEEIRDTATVREIAAKALAAITEPIRLRGGELVLSTSLGIALYPDDAAEADELLRHADLAMYHAKKNGRDQFRFYLPTMNAQAKERQEMERALEAALANGEFELYFQPQLSLHVPARVEAGEALLRWRHPGRGLLEPAAFLPVAEESGLIVGIGEWALREGCRQHARWRADSAAPPRLAVNCSWRQLRAPDFVGRLARLLVEEGMPPGQLELEFSERDATAHPAQSRGLLEQIKALGVRLCIDGYGGERLGLRELARLRPDRIKLQPAAVRELSGADGEPAAAIIAAGQALRAETVAVGVETGAQQRTLADYGCAAFQGALGYPPMSAGDFAALVSGRPA